MQSMGIYEAKTHFAALIDRASKGQRITVTRRGVPMATIGPPEKTKKKSSADAVDALLKFREKNKLTLGIPFKKAIEEGRP